MDEIRRQDQKIFRRELLRGSNIALTILWTGFIGILFAAEGINVAWLLSLLSIVPGALALRAYNRAIDRRFIDHRFKLLWEGCRDRYQRFDAVLTQMRREQIADLQEMPKTVKRVAEALYEGLRRADMIADDIKRTEQDIVGHVPAWKHAPNDKQAQELYQQADRNIAEYRQQFAGIMAGVQRTEAQAAVFMTTVDSLRVKMIGYRIAGRSPELSHNEFLSAMNEAKVQLHAIDRALEELDFNKLEQSIKPYPPQIEASNIRTGL